ncbi:MerR family transcriptional regulator [Chenggangzhangella methanolivorans]|uniref:Helix-turn-helix domain-containing protein n=1 Tax=Chenggangzhangella methanolivorans TaxID=1437009 RepID=A0A9E6UQ08_9HYPH|nr:helix-turn-helix domain-containing protein [Chenggangzhangella methanolivorans]QZO00365.1 helix-turn-helix domain-containing protein [Chenggangzhangella methanolivorans]
MELKIGELASLTGTNAPTVRYYEEIGLLPKPARRDGGQRSYGDGDVSRLTFIRRCREFGFPIERVRDLVGLLESPERPCVEARDLAAAQLAEVRKKLKELRALERSIADFVTRCDESCAGGPGSDCVILEDLARPDCGCGH